jgi:tetratricopeptide (TPR) repeat protein
VIRLLLLVALSIGAALPAQAAQVEPIPYQRGRLDRDRMDALIERPRALFEAGDVRGAIAALDEMIAQATAAHGARSVEVADLLTASGVELTVQGPVQDNPDLWALSLTYLERAIPVYRAAFGPDHPEVAIALHSWADVERRVHPDAPAAAEAALAEAYRIRLAALGAHDRETIWTLLRLNELRDLPAMVGGQPARIAAVAAELERAAWLSTNAEPDVAAQGPVAAHLRRAELYARQRQPQRALEALREARAAAGDIPDFENCLALSDGISRLLEIFGENGMTAEARALDREAAGDLADCLVLTPPS